jgi:hypothetical protein
MSTTETHADGSVTHWLTLPASYGIRSITTGELAETLVSVLSQEARESLIEDLCDF